MWALTPRAEGKPQGDRQGEGRVMVEAEAGVRRPPAKGRQDCSKHCKLGIPLGACPHLHFGLLALIPLMLWLWQPQKTNTIAYALKLLEVNIGLKSTTNSTIKYTRCWERNSAEVMPHRKQTKANLRYKMWSLLPQTKQSTMKPSNIIADKRLQADGLWHLCQSP